jgi:hypothetical protein
MLYRHGDVLLADIPEVPEGARPHPGLVLAYGEATGHSHRVEPEEAAELYELDNVLYLRVRGGPATLVHEEHAPIALRAGSYRVWRQREYTPRELRVVVD